MRSTAPGGGYTTMSGTSMAAPHVAGAVALCLDEGGTPGRCAGLSPAQIIERMRTHGHGRLAAAPGYGFLGDPSQAVSGRYYGWLAWAGASSADSIAPAVTSVSPAEGETGVARSTGVRVAFSEAMDRPAAEAAFSLVRGSDGARVTGSFSWSGDTMAFRPSSPLGHGVSHNAKVGTGARDAAGNRLEAERRWSFKTLASVAATPVATAIQAGSLRSGNAGRLAADDDRFFDINSTRGGTRTTSWYGRVTGVSNALRGLRVAHKGRNSASCSQDVAIWHWTTSRWVTLDARTVGTTERLVDRGPSGRLDEYVSGLSGDGEVRVRCARSSSSYARGDLMRVTHERP